MLVATLLLLDTIEPELDNTSFLIAMGVLGVGMGLIVSQLGNVVQSSVGEEDRSEAGGLQNTAQQLGSSLGTAFLGAVVITGLISAFSANVVANPKVETAVKEQVQVRLGTSVSFVAASQVEASAQRAGVKPATVQELVGDYEDAQLRALKTAFLLAAGLVLAALFATRNLPIRRFDQLERGADHGMAPT